MEHRGKFSRGSLQIMIKQQNGFLITYRIIYYFIDELFIVCTMHVYFAEQLLFIFQCISSQQNVLPATAIKMFNKCMYNVYSLWLYSYVCERVLLKCTQLLGLLLIHNWIFLTTFFFPPNNTLNSCYYIIEPYLKAAVLALGGPEGHAPPKLLKKERKLVHHTVYCGYLWHHYKKKIVPTYA